MTPTKLLTLEILIDACFAALLLGVPNLTVRILGWPQAGSTFWPRMVGALLAGATLATIATVADWTRDGDGAGFGLTGHVAVNMTVAFVLISMLVLGPEHPTHRGKLFTWLLAIGLVVLSLVEIAYL